MFDDFFNLSNPYFLGIMERFIINLFFLFLLIRVVYFRFTKKEMLLFTFFLMGITIYFIGSILNSIMLEFGMAVGLVAVFTILRFRTTQISIKDMAYLFATIGISVINALRMVDFPMLGRFIVNIILILSAYILELYLVKHRSDSFNIVYENIDLLRPEKKDELIKELSELTGRKINRVKIENVDYKKRMAEIEIYYKEQ
jgi:hypothetical protein